ncbi:MAG: polysaccharide biosynthesis tyrosine autokinase [Prevotella sp.]|nr:polysaccharide biosynthesis tyrosine autokinase [Prevotella sp.]
MIENNFDNNITTEKYIEEESGFDFRTIFVMFILNWQWFLVSIIICFCSALLYLRYKSPVYQVTAKMLIKDEANNRNRGSQMLANMKEFGFMTNSTGLDNEIEILKSNSLSTQTVKNLKLYTEYKIFGKIKNNLIYDTQPINVDLDDISLNKMDEMDRPMPIYLQIEKTDNEYIVEGYTYDENGIEIKFNTSFIALPYRCKISVGTLTFTKNHNGKAMNLEKPEIVKITAPKIIGTNYAGRLEIEPTSKLTSIAKITLKDEEFHRATNFLKELANVYNEQANEDKNQIALKTEEFINGRLQKIDAELNATEGELETYKRINKITELKLDATQSVAQTSEYSTKLYEAKSQIQLMDYLRQYINEPANKYQIIPSNVGLQDNASTSLINQYNQIVLERNKMLRSASEIAPQVQTLTNTLNELLVSIKVALQQASYSANIKLNNIEQQYAMYQNRVGNTPAQERILTQIGRQQEVKSGLYLMLLQKREENSISLSATADKGKLIDTPVFEGQISPKRPTILMGAFVIGIGLPLAIILLLQLLKYKIENHEDIAKITKLPIIADIPVANDNVKRDAGIVVKDNTNNTIDEVFRSLRTNIQFMMKGDEKVILFTSSTSGEGKTFNAANIATSFAFLGKKVVLLGLDIRKPALGKLFNVTDRSGGITILLGKAEVTKEDVMQQLRPSGINDNLKLILAGPVPPNPTELLARKNLKDIIDFLKEDFDYIILDTAPVGLVTDTIHIGKHADVTVFICRADYTPKNSIKLFNDLAKENKMPNCCIAINGIDMSKKKYGYYYGYGKYGRYSNYGYGHGGYGTYGTYRQSTYGNQGDDSIKM